MVPYCKPYRLPCMCIFNLLVFVVCIQVSWIMNKVVHRSKVKVIISHCNRMKTVLFSCYLIYALPCLYHAFLIICDFNLMYCIDHPATDIVLVCMCITEVVTIALLLFMTHSNHADKRLSTII